ncbi:HD domain-containing protein [Hymenobacter busanensis]|uniref:HD domain-containing protein n=1 Tax=Hymenobacter busanensis TaxID=2607656 RepID=A0A7L4ZWM3_9BACT|nr:Pycsar system effector family protein [Hymenobacter busanensis]KAA9333433.1 HD domain-containing protein [Hymenobacter busanensis]QHJ07884.1 HD domain-containing protein [Hymenobacter busanensis]
MEPTTTLPKASKAEIVKQAKAHIEQLFEAHLPKQLVYHSFKHTAGVAKETAALAEAARLDPADQEALLLAAWFHDAGFTEKTDGHEFRSTELAEQWLQERHYPADRIALVKQLIEATHRDAKRETELEKILVDADMSSLGKEEFFANAELLRAEWETTAGRVFSNVEWAEYQLDFLLTHKFCSDVAQERYKEQLKENIKDQRKLLKKLEKKKKKRENEKDETFAEGKRGVETMFRATYSQHIQLSGMADQKANMMISLNAVLLSIIITYLGAKTSTLGPAFTRNPVLAVPMGLLVATSLGSVVTAILSAQPDVTSFKWLRRSPQIATNRRVNLLFFGNFTKLSLDHFQEGMTELMRNKDMLYTNMVTDIYYLGEVLARKYRLLRTSYTIFMVGLILTAISFAIVLLYKA